MRKLLIITYKFPPVQAPSSIRLFHFYQEALAFFDDVQVLTSKNRRWMKQDASLDTGIDATQLTEVMAYDLRYYLVGKQAQKKSVTKKTNTNEGSWKGFFRKAMNSFPLNFLFDDGGLFYILKGYSSYKNKIEEEGVTHIFSSFRPYSDHIIAYLLKRKYPHLYWIADFRDLHVDPVMNNVFFPKIQHRWNQFFLRKSNLITTVSQGLADQLSRYNRPIYVLRNGLGRQAAAIDERGGVLPYFSVLYTGAMFFDKRDIRPILDAFKALIEEKKIKAEECQLIYAGNDGHIWERETEERGLRGLLVNKGLVSRREVLALQRQVQINVLLTYASQDLTGNMTSKVYEYFEAGRPILASIKGTRDIEIEAIFAALNAGAVIYENVDELKVFLLTKYLQWKQKGDVGFPIDKEGLKAYRWPTMMQQLWGDFIEDQGS